MRTYNRFIAALFLAVLAGCSGFTPPQLFQQGTLPNTLPNALSQNDQSTGFHVKGPDGYCIIPPEWHRVQMVNGLALASCNRLGAGFLTRVDDGTVLPYMLTVSTTGLAAPKADEMMEYLTSASGRATLAHDGQAASVQINRRVVTDQGAYVNFTDTSAPAHLGQRVWKGMIIVEGRIVLVGLYAGENNETSSRAGEVVLREFASNLIKHNHQE